MNRRILPTHHCFDDALDFMAFRLKMNPADAERLILVHAVCLAPADGPSPNEPYTHAWCEDGDQVWDAGLLDGELHIYYSVQRDEYYASRRPIDMTRYTAAQAWQQNERSGNFGPWEERYIALCGSSGRILGGATITNPMKGR